MDKESDLQSYQSLLQQFELTKKELGDAEESIRRITGRDPDLFPGEAKGQAGPNKWKQQSGLPPFAGGHQQPFVGRNKRALFPIVKEKDDEIPVDEDSPDEEIPAKKPSLSSAVIATPKDLKSRRETIQEQNINSKVKARNRRMFGMILGTLQKFQHDAKKRKEQDKKRAEVEQKIEAATAEEKERMKKEKEELFQTRRVKQTQLRCLEKKMEIAELHEVWEKSQMPLVNYIFTKTEPSIAFLPKNHTPESSKLLKESRAKVLESIRVKREKMEIELQEVEKWYQKDNFPSDKENIGPTEDEPNESADNPDGQNDGQNTSDPQSEVQVTGEVVPEITDESPESPQEMQSPLKPLATPREIAVTEPENLGSDEEMSTKNKDEDVNKEQSDQDFEPIYD